MSLLLLVLGACGGDGQVERQIGTPGESDVDIPAFGGCGERLNVETGGQGPLSLTGSFPAKADVGGERLSGTVTVTNRSGERFTGVAATSADVFVVRSGLIVATPLDKDDAGLALDLAPGATRAFPATLSLRRCDPSRGARLEPGLHELYAVLEVSEDPEGRALVVASGPWPLEMA